MYLTLAIVGLLLVVLAGLVDGIFDAFDFDLGGVPILMASSIAILAFGAGGGILQNYSDNTTLVLVISIVSAVIIVGIFSSLWIMIKKNAEADEAQNNINSLIGKTMKVTSVSTTTIRGLIQHRGAPVEFNAPLIPNVKVADILVVEAIIDDRNVVVKHVEDLTDNDFANRQG